MLAINIIEPLFLKVVCKLAIAVAKVVKICLDLNRCAVCSKLGIHVEQTEY